MTTLAIARPLAAALAAEYAAAVHADNTRRTYETQWRQWSAWAAANDVSALPATPQHVAEYLAVRTASGRKQSTIRVDAAAIRHAHVSAGLDDPTADYPRRVQRGARRRHAGEAPAQAAPLLFDDFAIIRRTAHLPRYTFGRGKGALETPDETARRARVDIALIALMLDALLRREEAAAARWRDLTACEDGTGRLRIPRSKGDPEGAGYVQYVRPRTMADLQAIRPDPCDGSLPIFGLSAGTIGRRIKAAAVAARLPDAERYSGHSCRIGMAIELHRAGADALAIQRAGRWRNLHTLAYYLRNEEAGRSAVALLDDGPTTSPRLVHLLRELQAAPPAEQQAATYPLGEGAA